MPARKKEPEDLTAKKELALEVIDRLKKEYPDAGCTLDYDHAWQLLVSVRLAAQCTDARVNIVVEDLFARYPSVAALAGKPKELYGLRLTSFSTVTASREMGCMAEFSLIPGGQWRRYPFG